MTTIDPQPPRTRDSFADAPDVVEEHLREVLPAWWAATERCVLSTTLGPYACSTGTTGNGALDIVQNQALNDFIDLVRALRHGEGRAAIRVARALFEHYVATLDLIADASLEERYLAHADVMEEIELRDDRMLDIYPPDVRRRARRRRFARLARVEPRAKDALARFGSAFRRSWAGETLRERAVRHGLKRDYDAYAVMSSVLHGTAHGAGSTIVEVDRVALHRTGGALLDAPVAMFHGVRFFRATVEALMSLVFDPTPAAEMLDALDELTSHIVEYELAVLELHDATTPTVWRPTWVAVVRVAPMGGRQWWVHLPEARLMRKALPPEDSDRRRRIEAQIREFAATAPDDWDGTATIALFEERLKIAPNQPWIADSEVLHQANPPIGL